MHSVALVTALLVAALAAATPARAADPPPQNQSTTIFGQSNPALSDGAAALDDGRVEEGIRLTLDGLKIPTPLFDKAAGYSNLCAGYALLQQWDLAIEHCNTALGIDRNNWRTFNNRAAAFAGKGQFDLAITDLRAGLDISPNSHTLRQSLRIVEENKRAVRRSKTKRHADGATTL
jgi:tetratricopeptide (TPR) repeat protein